MNKTKLLTFITLEIIILFSCKLNYEDVKNKVASFTETKHNESNQSNSQKNTKEQEHQKLAKDLKVTEKKETNLIDKLFEILAREMTIIKKEKLQTEISSQFGLKNSMFELINVYKIDSTNGEKLREKMNSSLTESQKMRRQFYSSLGYNTTDIFNLAEIVNKLYKNSKTHDSIKKISGGIQIQQRFEVALEDLAINMEKLKANNFNQKTLEEIYNIIIDLIEIKKEWLSTIKTLIKSSNATLELQNNTEKLTEHIDQLYKDKMISICLKSEQALIYLDTLFKNNNN
ncbi:complement regulator-acquiring protein (plasmid) [Borrelia sp. CA_690]|uniref:Complement regulator-acquiring protein n=1 Tax=Borrelia maritima TaxID=2761123 RepID=A0A5J6WFT1_9SPIR|nr:MULTISPECIES: complement regulator-acquiring protein [Borrelia]QFI14999.1 complement regulator-acquiring protein [Borrelia maritima]WKC84006.1 complement regulator-acquiring protein [Borrelia sp. CA_690]